MVSHSSTEDGPSAIGQGASLSMRDEGEGTEEVSEPVMSPFIPPVKLVGQTKLPQPQPLSSAVVTHPATPETATTVAGPVGDAVAQKQALESPRAKASKRGGLLVTTTTTTKRDSVRETLQACYGYTDPLSLTTVSLLPDLFKQKLLFHPDSGLRGYWDVVMSVLIVYSVSDQGLALTVRIIPCGYGVRLLQVLSVTFRLGFNVEPVRGWFVWDMTVDALFFADILGALNTAFWSESGHLVMDRKTIALRYGSTWLFWDLLSTVSQ
jgi:hypothetical protein